MSNYISVKADSDIKLSGIKVDVKIVNDLVKTLTLVDIDGNELFISVGSYSVDVCIPKPVLHVTCYTVDGKAHVAGSYIPVSKTFSSRQNAERFCAELDEGSITEVSTPEANAPIDDIPF